MNKVFANDNFLQEIYHDRHSGSRIVLIEIFQFCIKIINLRMFEKPKPRKFHKIQNLKPHLLEF